jgi:hypothetical protein
MAKANMWNWRNATAEKVAVDDQFEYFMSQNYEAPMRKQTTTARKLKDIVKILFAMFFVVFVACPLLLFAVLLCLGVVARLNGH